MTRDWRSALRTSITWLLLIKLAGLILLWAFFFSPAHRARVTSEGAAHMFAVDGSQHD